MAKRTTKKVEAAETGNTPTTIGKTDIKRSALEAWRKLDEVIQKELASMQTGAKELNASAVTAIVKYIETSVSLASGSDDLSEKDKQDRNKAMFGNMTLPTFDDEETFE